MYYGVPTQQGVKRSISKVGTLITNDSSGHAISWKYVLSKEFHNHLSIIGPQRDDLYLLRNMVHS